MEAGRGDDSRWPCTHKRRACWFVRASGARHDVQATLRRRRPDTRRRRTRKEPPLARHPSPEAIAAQEAAMRHPHVADLAVRDVFVGAWGLYRREPVRVSVSALVLLAPGLVMGVGTGAFIDRIQDDTLNGKIVLAVVIAVIAGIIGTLGTVFYAGVLDELVGAVIRGQDQPSLRAVLRELPVWRLIGADLVVTFIVGVASSVLVAPGFILLAMLSTVGPIVNIEHRRVFPSIRRADLADVPAPVADPDDDRLAPGDRVRRGPLLPASGRQRGAHRRVRGERAADPDGGRLGRAHRGRARLRAPRA